MNPVQPGELLRCEKVKDAIVSSGGQIDTFTRVLRGKFGVEKSAETIRPIPPACQSSIVPLEDVVPPSVDDKNEGQPAGVVDFLVDRVDPEPQTSTLE